MAAILMLACGTPARAAESLAYGANTARTNEGFDPMVFGPLHPSWTESFSGHLGQPLVVDGKLIVNVGAVAGFASGSYIHAFDPRTGEKLWTAEGPGRPGAAPIAAEDGRVLAANSYGLLALSAETGEEIWSRPAPSNHFTYAATPPAISDGVAYVQLRVEGGSGVYAIRMSDGQTLWARMLDSSFTDWDRGPVVDGARVYAGGCNATAALRRSDGAMLWSNASVGDCDSGKLHEGELFVGATVHNAASGARAREIRPVPQAVAGGLGFTNTGPLPGGFAAFSLADGEVRWAKEEPAGAGPPYPLVTGGTVFAEAGTHVLGYVRTTGQRITRVPLDPPIGSVENRLGGFAAGAGRLFLAVDEFLYAFEPILKPEWDGVDLVPATRAVVIGEPALFTVGVGPGVRHPNPEVTLLATPQSRRERAALRAPTWDDGSRFLRPIPSRNTRYQARLPSGARSRPWVIYAYPKYGLRFKTRRNRLHIAAKVSRVPRRFLEGRRVFAYLGGPERGQLTRRGDARLGASGAREARALIPFKLPRFSLPGDYVTFCVKGLARSGFGATVGLDRHCGDGRVASTAATRASRRAGPTQRRWPAAGRSYLPTAPAPDTPR